MDRTTKTSKALAKYQGMSFEYGETDCCQFVVNVASEVSGKDINLEMNGLVYSTKEEAKRLIKAGGIRAQANRILGSECEFTDAQNGDIVLVTIPISVDWVDNKAVGIKFNGRVYVRTEKGLMSVPRERAICAWRI